MSKSIIVNKPNKENSTRKKTSINTHICQIYFTTQPLHNLQRKHSLFTTRNKRVGIFSAPEKKRNKNENVPRILLRIIF